MWLADIFGSTKQNRFFALLKQMATICVEAARTLQRYVESGNSALSDEVNTLEKQGDETVQELIAALTESFVTPLDRQDIYNLGEAIDDMIDYLNNAAREIKLFGVAATPAMREMMQILVDGATHVDAAVSAVVAGSGDAAKHARLACEAENRMERVYRAALAELFDDSDMHRIFKLREIYRHLSNSADRTDAVGKLIGKIVVKVG